MKQPYDSIGGVGRGNFSATSPMAILIVTGTDAEIVFVATLIVPSVVPARHYGRTRRVETRRW